MTMSELDRNSEAVAYYDHLISRFPTDQRLGEWLNDRCWTRATANVELVLAKLDCEGALKLRPGASGFLDSRALLELRQGRLEDARKDYDAALAGGASGGTTYYGRALVRTRQGDLPGAKADFAAAAKADPKAQARFAAWGLRP
jgi:tetratricopeptide (TPR) repeat protein